MASLMNYLNIKQRNNSSKHNQFINYLDKPNQAKIARQFKELGIQFRYYKSVFNELNTNQISSQDARQIYNKNSFFSTPNFLADLTYISVKVVKVQQKMNYLMSNLNKINKNLPAACYLPILSNDQRNYMVLNLIVNEIRVFITAQKAPYLILIEVFQPQEIELLIQDEINAAKPRASEILEELKLFNKDQWELMKKVNHMLSKPQYVSSSNVIIDDRTSDGESQVSQISIRDIMMRSKQLYTQ